jgi:excisionase family DNA binding protein
MNLQEAADYLRVSARLVEKLVSQHRLKPARINRRLIFKRSELDRYVDLQMARCA